MPTPQEGTSSPDVLKLQKSLNLYMDQTVCPTNGAFDENTSSGIKAFQKRWGIPTTGKLDSKTQKALEEAGKQRCKVTLKGKTYLLTKAEFAALEKRAIAQLKGPAQAYANMANEAQTLWDAHKKARDQNVLFAAIVDGATGVSLPAKGVITKATAAAASMTSAVSSGNVEAAAAAMKKNGDIRAAIAAMSQYRDALYGGGTALIGELQKIQTACEVILTVSAAIATGGASWGVQAGVAGAVGAYKGVLGEIDKAGKFDPKQTWGSAFENVVASGLIEAAVSMLMGKGGGGKEFVEALAERAAKKVAGAALKKVGSEAVKKYALNAIKGGASSVVENLLKDLIKSCDPSSKMTFDKAVDNIAKNFAKGATFGALDNILSAFGKSAGKHFNAKDFKGLGKVDYSEALKGGGSKALEQAYDKWAPAVVNAAAAPPNKAKIQASLVAKMKADAALQKWFTNYGKKNKKKK